MTANSVQNPPRSRRALLAGALGGLGAWAASTVSRVDPTLAAAGDPIRMGRLNRAASTETTLQTKTSGAAFQVNQIGAGPAVKGIATNGRAVMGVAGHSGTGVWAWSPDHYAVRAATTSGTALYSQSDSGTALYATSGERAAFLNGAVEILGYQDLFRVGVPNPPAYAARLFTRLSVSGRHELCVRFPTGDVQVIAAEL